MMAFHTSVMHCLLHGCTCMHGVLEHFCGIPQPDSRHGNFQSLGRPTAHHLLTRRDHDRPADERSDDRVVYGVCQEADFGAPADGLSRGPGIVRHNTELGLQQHAQRRAHAGHRRSLCIMQHPEVAGHEEKHAVHRGPRMLFEALGCDVHPQPQPHDQIQGKSDGPAVLCPELQLPHGTKRDEPWGS